MEKIKTRLDWLFETYGADLENLPEEMKRKREYKQREYSPRGQKPQISEQEEVGIFEDFVGEMKEQLEARIRETVIALADAYRLYKPNSVNVIVLVNGEVK